MTTILLLCFCLLPLLLLPYSSCLCNINPLLENGDSAINGMFVFGSSLVDNGNNNFLLNSLAKANYSPYGLDFPLGTTGRWTNGKNVVDLLGDYLGLPFIPTFKDPSTNGTRIVRGVNYASGASGILDNTGLIVREVITLSQQIKSFEEVTLPELEVQLGCSSRESLPKYLFVVGTGGNDYSLNYFLTGGGSGSNNVSVEAFTTNLTAVLTAQLQRLYNVGVRKFVVMGVNPNGCSPSVRAPGPGVQGCIRDQNQAIELFNLQLRSMVLIRPKMPLSKMVFVNSYQILIDLIINPASQGFKDAQNKCCQVSALGAGGNGLSCDRGGSTCPDRSVYVYYDGLHPTEAANVVIAKTAFASDLKTYVYPFNLKQLSSTP